MAHYRDPETGGHLDRMERYSKIIATHLADKYNFNDEIINTLGFYARLHDIGKIGIEDSILLCPQALGKKQFETMMSHATKGYNIIQKIVANFHFEEIDNIDMLYNIVHFHHEAWDGSGYPNGLSGENIPIEARIVSLVDIFDALTSKRPYKEPWPFNKAIAEIEKLAGSKLDPGCVKVMIDTQQQFKEICKHFHENDET